MIMKAFAIWDLKALNFGVPFFMPSVGGAVRAFGDLAIDGQSTVAKHPSDFILFEIGTYDDTKGVLLSLDKHVHLGMASDYIKRPQPSPAVDVVDRMVKEPLSTVHEVNGGKK